MSRLQEKQQHKVRVRKRKKVAVELTCTGKGRISTRQFRMLNEGNSMIIRKQKVSVLF